MTNSGIESTLKGVAALIAAVGAPVAILLQRDQEKLELEKRKLRLEIEVIKKKHGIHEPEMPAHIPMGKPASLWPWAFIAGCIPSIISLSTFAIELLADIHDTEWNGPAFTMFGIQLAASLALALIFWIILCKFLSSRTALFFMVSLFILLLQNSIISVFWQPVEILWSTIFI